MAETTLVEPNPLTATADEIETWLTHLYETRKSARDKEDADRKLRRETEDAANNEIDKAWRSAAKIRRAQEAARAAK